MLVTKNLKKNYVVWTFKAYIKNIYIFNCKLGQEK